MAENTEIHVPEVPDASLGDQVHAIVRAGLGAIPFAGQAAMELFAALLTPPLERRQKEWMREVGDLLAKLSEGGKVNLDDLQKDERFIDLLMDASQAAIRNANEEKRQALRNAIENAALGQAPEESLQHIFIRYVDELTVWHLRLLKLFQDPTNWAKLRGHKFPSWYASGLSALLESAYPELSGKRDFYDQVWRDLYLRGLTNTDGLHTTMSANGLFASRASAMGSQFLQFIEKPG